MNILDKMKQIKVFALDIDGVLTNGGLLILDDGQMVRQMNIKDGYALQLAIKKGFKVVIISGGSSTSVQNRLQKLGVKDVYLKVEDKKQKLQEWCIQEKIDIQNVLYMGDDMPDYEVIKIVGIGACPKDAASEIQQQANYISIYKGGEGCVREVIEKILKINDLWE